MKLLIVTFALLLLSGCMPSRGWQVQFGISPVSSIDHNQGFSAPDTVPVKARRANY